MTYKKGDIVTLPGPIGVSNTYLVELEMDDNIYVVHPLAPGVLLTYPKTEIDKVNAEVKDSSERGLLFCKKNQSYLDFNDNQDIEALILYYVVHKRLTPRQKKALSDIRGKIASHLLNSSVELAIRIITDNEGVLDEFNSMWASNFKELFQKRKSIISAKQKNSIFNIAGFVLSELETPSTVNRYNSEEARG